MMREIKDVNKLRQDVTVYQNKIIQQQVFKYFEKG